MVEAAVKFAFENLNLAEITLRVFDFNTLAIDNYKSIGFREFQFDKGARQFQNESWNVLKGIESDAQKAARLLYRPLTLGSLPAEK